MVLEPLVWIVRDYCALTAGDRVHRLGCRKVTGAGWLLRPGSRLARYQAPTPCSTCRPRLELRLSA